jgi:hypothetical protein
MRFRGLFSSHSAAMVVSEARKELPLLLSAFQTPVVTPLTRPLVTPRMQRE